MCMRTTARNHNGMVYIPGYAPKCNDPATCEMIVKAVKMLAALEDLLEYPGVFDSIPQEAIDNLKKEGILE